MPALHILRHQVMNASLYLLYMYAGKGWYKRGALPSIQSCGQEDCFNLH
jgi:hypothetical protein